MGVKNINMGVKIFNMGVKYINMGVTEITSSVKLLTLEVFIHIHLNVLTCLYYNTNMNISVISIYKKTLTQGVNTPGTFYS